MSAFTLRPYQQHSVASVIQHFRQSDAPAVLVLPTGAGKSLVIAELARKARGRVLVLAHVKELVEQNHSKYESYGLKASIFSAGLKQKSVSEQVVFGSVQSVVRNLSQFQSSAFTLLIIDECHRVSMEKTTSYQQVIQYLRTYNPQLKVLGLTATPYRLGEGWIYQYQKDIHSKTEPQRGTVKTHEPRFFESCLYELPLSYMINNGFLTPPLVVDAPIVFYDFSRLLEQNPNHFREADMNALLQENTRTTRAIVDHIIQHATTRKGVMIFASTVNHAKEVMSYLPDNEAALIIGDTAAKERGALIEAFKQQTIKYLVNVSVLTTGFDAPHVDFIAILRPTESVSLYQQIAGRGLRLSPDKTDCLIVDYAGNRFNLFSPEVGEPRPDSKAVPVTIDCPVCDHHNAFWGILDDDGHLVEHYGRRCQGYVEEGNGRRQCEFRFRFKECEQCGAENDIAARRCGDCGTVLVDPDKKLREALNLKHCKVLRCSGMEMLAVEKAGKQRLKIVYHDEDGASLCEVFSLDSPAAQGAFYHHFGKHALVNRAERFRAESVAQVVASRKRFRAPDFVIATLSGKGKAPRYWQIVEKMFDYHGQFRTADKS